MKNKITILLCLLFLIVLFSISSAFAYTDVSSSHWAYEAINKLSETGALNGYSDGSFRPSQGITRAEFCKIIVELLGEKAPAQNNNYQDVNRFHWANEYIKKASSYLNANSNRFYPEGGLLREDAALAMVNVIGKQNEKPNEKTLDVFTDENLISEDHEKYVALAVENGIMDGNANGTFNPLGTVTRAEMCQIIYNVMIRFPNAFAVKNKAEEIVVNNNKDDSGAIIVTPIKKTNVDPNIWLNVTIEGGTLKDGGTYTLGKEEYIIATIGNPSSEKNFIYYSFAYGTNYQTIVVKKVEDFRAEITIPDELVGKNVKLSIWGTSTKNGKGYMTATQIFMLNYTSDLSHRGESYSESYNVNIENRKADFIIVFNGETIEPETIVENVKQGQKLIIRSKPVNNIQSINYRWDKNIEYTVVNHATETIEIPESFANGTTHKLTVRIIDKEGNVYMPRIFRFTMYGKAAISSEQ